MNSQKILPDIIHRIVIDNSLNTPRYIVISQNQKYIQISAMAHIVLEKIQQGHSFASIAQEISEERRAAITAEEIRRAYDYVVKSIQAIDSTRRDQQGAFWVKVPILSTSKVQSIAATLTGLFHPLAIICLPVILLFLLIYAWRQGLLGSDFFHQFLPSDLPTLLLTYALFALSLVAHEFGHASACQRGGVRPGDIGFALYLIFPAFYSDVSAAWELSRWQKVRVDIGGIYLQLWVGAGYFLIYLISGQRLFQAAFLTILGSCALSLNPLLKFDGYWIVADMLGIPNLYKQPGQILSHLYLAACRQPRKPLPWTVPVSCIIALYGIARVAMWVALLLAILPITTTSLQNYPTLIARILQHIHYGYSALLLADIQKLGSSSLFLPIWIVGLVQAGQFILACAQRKPDH